MGNNMMPNWETGWDERIRQAVRELGYNNFVEFMNTNVGVPYGILIRQLRSYLNEMIPLMQLTKLHMIESIAAGKARYFAMDSLVRSLRNYLSKGWGKGKKASEKRASAFADWVLPCDNPEKWGNVCALADKVWEELKALNPPSEWCPTSPDDPLIKEAFKRGWPHENSDSM